MELNVILGNFIGDESIVWSPFVKGHHKLVVLGEDKKINQVLMNIEKQILSVDGVGYFKINFNDQEELENKGSLSKITEFEKEPEKSIPNQLLANHRKDFVDMYIGLLLDYIGLDRRELKVSYRPTLEGILPGYIRAAECLEGREWGLFKEHLTKLDNILWENEGDVFSYKINETDPVSQHLEFLKGVWSFWVFCMITPVDISKVIQVEIPNTSHYNERQNKELNRMLEVLEDVSNMSNTSLILASKEIAPIGPRTIRYKLLVNNSGVDFDFTGTSLEFEDGGSAFIFVDDAYNRKIIGNLID